jgi:4-amino-4-deoxy-L-arabinose transferase-like glycosyltransferase
VTSLAEHPEIASSTDEDKSQVDTASTQLLDTTSYDTVVIPVVIAAPAPAARRKRWRWLPLGAVVVAILTIQAWNITGYPFASDDEGTYLAQAWAVQHGIGLAHYTYWYDHPPLGWLQLAAVSWLPALFLPEHLAVATGRLAMLPVTAVSLILVHTLCRRIGFAQWAALLAVVLYGLSPLSVTMERQIYLDSFAVAWMLAAFVLALSPRRHLWHHVAAGVAVAVAVLSKETMLIVLPAVVVALLGQGTARGLRAYSAAGFTAGLVLVGVFYPVYAMLKGEFLPGSGHVSLVGAWQFQLQSRSGSGSIFSAGSGANKLLHSWLYYDNVLLYGGVAATVAALFVRRLRAPALAAALLTAMAMRPGGYLPAMYVIQVLPFLAIALAGVVEVVATRLWTMDLSAFPGVSRIGRGSRDWARWTRWARWAPVAVLVVAAGLAVAVVVPRWADGDRRAMTARDNDRYTQAAAWMRKLPDHGGTRVVTDDVLWLDLVRAGFSSEHVIWFYKLDLDPAVAKTLPDGWRDINYLVSTPAMRSDPGGLPTIGILANNSTVVASFGTGADRIEIRQVTREGT